MIIQVILNVGLRFCADAFGFESADDIIELCTGWAGSGSADIKQVGFEDDR